MDPKLEEALEQARLVFEEVSAQNRKEADSFWNDLTYDQQLMAFYAVVSRIYKGEIEDKGSYRWVLYDVFGFGPDAYGLGMDCGYMSLHNSISDGESVVNGELLRDFANFANVDCDVVSKFIAARYL
jgi:hypothetical protein